MLVKLKKLLQRMWFMKAILILRFNENKELRHHINIVITEKVSLHIWIRATPCIDHKITFFLDQVGDI